MKNIDETGNIHGRLLVQSRVENNKHNQIQWKCLCSCGKQTITTGVSLRAGTTKSCGCLHNELASKQHTIDLTGQKFGRLAVIRRVGTKNSYATWLCECACGKPQLSKSIDLRSGNTQSCGCLRSYPTTKQLTKHLDSLSKSSLLQRIQRLKERKEYLLANFQKTGRLY